MAHEWDADQECYFNPPKDKIFVGGQPVKPPKKAEKCCDEIPFTFQSTRLSELQRMSDEGDVIGAGSGFFEMGVRFDRGDGDDGGVCLLKAFQCYKAAFREGYLPAVQLLQSRVRCADDIDAINRADGKFITLVQYQKESDDPESSMIFVSSNPDQAYFPYAAPHFSEEDDIDRW